MTNNKKKKKTKVKKEIVYRTKKERQEEVKNILKQLSEFDLDIKYDPIKKLYQQFKTYIAEGNRILINIPSKEPTAEAHRIKDPAGRGAAAAAGG